MLNKLLKRCMPWMDKGRWYRCNVKQPIYGDPVFMLPPGWTGSKASGSDHWIIDTNIKAAHILDSKIRMYGEPGDDFLMPETNNLLSIELDNDGNILFDIDYDIGMESDIKCVFDVFIEVI